MSKIAKPALSALMVATLLVTGGTANAATSPEVSQVATASEFDISTVSDAAILAVTDSSGSVTGYRLAPEAASKLSALSAELNTRSSIPMAVSPRSGGSSMS